MRALVALAAFAALASPASAAPPWSVPQDLSSAHLFIDRPALVVSGDGTALATWDYGDRDADGNPRGATSAAARAPGAEEFGPARALVRRDSAYRVEEVATYGRRRGLLAFTRAGGPDRLGVRFGSADGRFGRRVTLRRADRRVGAVDLAVNASGDAAVAWFEDRGVRTMDRVYVALRRAGGRFGTPRRLATGRIRGVSVAVGASGDVLVAWDARGVLRTRFKPRGRRSFRTTETIRSEEAFRADLHPVVTPNGRAVLAWSAQFVSEGGDSREGFVQAAVRPSGARRFRPAQLLERLGSEQRPRPVDAVADSTGRVVVAWTGADRRVRAAAADQAGRFGPAGDVSAPGVEAILTDLAAGPGGRLIAVWDDGVDTPRQVRAALVPSAGAPFGPPEDASPAGQESRAGHAAFHPATGRPTIVWSNRPDGSTRTFAQAATRAM